MTGPNYEICHRFGANLRRHRSDSDLSQEELGFLAGLHRTEIGMLERGVRLPRVDTLVKLTSVLGVTPDALLDGIEWVPERERTEGSFRMPEQPEAERRPRNSD